MATWGYRMICKYKAPDRGKQHAEWNNGPRNTMTDDVLQLYPRNENVLDTVHFHVMKFTCGLLLHGRSLLTGYNLNKLKAFYNNIWYSFIYRVFPPFIIEVLLYRNDVSNGFTAYFRWIAAVSPLFESLLCSNCIATCQLYQHQCNSKATNSSNVFRLLVQSYFSTYRISCLIVPGTYNHQIPASVDMVI